MEEHNLGIILIAMSSLFIFCQSFKIIPDLYEIIHCNHVGSLGDNCEFAPVINAILRLSHLLVCVNSSANFLIYYARGEKFRRAWIDTFGAFWCYCCAKSENNSTSSQITELQTTIQTNGHSTVLCTTVVEPINSNSATTTATTTNSPSKQKLLNAVTKKEDFLTVQNHVFVGSNQNNSHDVEDVSL